MAPILERLLGLFYPPVCPACGRDASGSAASGPPSLCEACDAALERNTRPCPRCAAPGVGRPCGACLSIPPAFDAAHCPLLYLDGGAAAGLLLRWKYGRDQVLGRALARWFAGACRARLGRYERIVPVPPRAARLLVYGFHPALSLAAALAPRHGRLDRGLLRRLGSRPQVELRGRDRRRNAARSFEPTVPARLGGELVLIVDDVMTTGATASACAAALRRAGAGRIHVAAFARAPARGSAAAPRAGARGGHEHAR